MLLTRLLEWLRFHVRKSEFVFRVKLGINNLLLVEIIYLEMAKGLCDSYSLAAPLPANRKQ
jgi:hypothetical protein